MNLRKTELFRENNIDNETFKLLSGRTFHAVFSGSSNSAAGTASIADELFPNMSGSMGVVRSQTITVTGH
jgi:hypothetical protein